MSLRLARWWLTAMVVATLLAPEALLLHRCPCGRLLDCCCRSLAAHRGQSCHLGPAKGHCSTRSSESVPPSVQSWRLSLDRVGTWEPQPFAVQLQAVARIAGSSSVPADGPAFAPPVPPPRTA